MDKKDRKIVDDAIQKYGDDFWNNYAESIYTKTNREGIVDELIGLLEQAGYKFVVKPIK